MPRPQAAKKDVDQPPLASLLPPLRLTDGTSPAAPLDAIVVGAGPAGLALAAELGAAGLEIALVGRDEPFVNTYGVWVDELAGKGLDGVLESTWDGADCFFGEGGHTRVRRPYGRVAPGKLRAALAARAASVGVRFAAAEVGDAGALDDGGRTARLSLRGGPTLHARLITLASGADAGRLLKYEAGAPPVAAQTAYGVEAEVEG